MRKILLSSLVIGLVFNLVLIKVTQAEEYGPPAGTNMGPSAAQLEQMNRGQARGDEMQKVGEAKQAEAEVKAFKQMSGKAIPQFEKAVKNFKAQVDKLNKKGTPTTPEMQQELDKMDAFIVELKAATSIETLEPLFDKFTDLTDSAQEALQKMSKGAKWPSVEKQATKLINDLSKQSASLQAKAKKKGLDDELAANFTELNAAIEKQKTTLETLKVQVKTDPDTVFDNIGDYFDSFKDIYENYIREISSSLDLKVAVKTQLPKFVSALDKRVKTLAKNKKIDITELKALVDQATAKLNEIKKLTAGKITDMDAVIDAIDELTNIGPQFEDKWEELTGKVQNDYMPKLPADKVGDYEVKMPSGLNTYLNPAK